MFDCDICGKSYKCQKSVYRHKREKHKMVLSTQFICGICNASYRRKVDLTSHAKEHRGKIRGSRILCPVGGCKRKFMNYSCLHKHLFKEHNLKLAAEKHEFTEMNGKVQYTILLIIFLIFFIYSFQSLITGKEKLKNSQMQVMSKRVHVSN